MIFSTEYRLAFDTLPIYYGENKDRTKRERGRILIQLKVKSLISLITVDIPTEIPYHSNA